MKLSKKERDLFVSDLFTKLSLAQNKVFAVEIPNLNRNEQHRYWLGSCFGDITDAESKQYVSCADIPQLYNFIFKFLHSKLEPSIVNPILDDMVAFQYDPVTGILLLHDSLRNPSDPGVPDLKKTTKHHNMVNTSNPIETRI